MKLCRVVVLENFFQMMHNKFLSHMTYLLTSAFYVKYAIFSNTSLLQFFCCSERGCLIPACKIFKYFITPKKFSSVIVGKYFENIPYLIEQNTEAAIGGVLARRCSEIYCIMYSTCTQKQQPEVFL